MSYKTKYFFMPLFLLILLCITGCMSLAERLPEEKNSRLYGVTEGLFRSRWWNYYERGRSFADGKFWKKAELDLKDALRQREADQRRARTYGRHFIDYFPHCELGVVLFRQGRIEEAINELETSLASVKTAKAELYLDRARKALIEKEQGEQAPPEINIRKPDHPLSLTNAFSIKIQGTAKDEKSFVRKITVGGKDFRMDVSSREVPFYMEIPIHQGKNEIPIRVTNLAGKTSEAFVTVHADRLGPVVGIDEKKIPTVLETFKVFAFDDSGLAELVINGEKILLDNSPQEFQIEKKILSSQLEGNEITIIAKDIAGNITSARIPLVPDPELVSGGELLLNRDRCVSRLLAENTVVPKEFLSDSLQGDLARLTKQENLVCRSKQLFAQADYNPQPFVRIRLNNPKTERVTYLDRITYLDKAVIDGEIDSHEKGVKLFLNGKQIFEVPRKVFHFSYLAELKAGDNILDVMAISPSRYSDAVTIKINRKIPCVRKPESRLKIALNFFKRKNTKTPLSVGFEYRLANVMREHHPTRFSRVEEILSDNNLEAMRKAARKSGFHCILVGNIEERKNSEGKKSLIITAHIEDTESGKIIVQTTDVYGEDADEDNIDGKLRTLAAYMKIKLIDELPMVEGTVLEKHKKEWIAVDLGQEEKIKEGMAFIVYKQGESILGFEEIIDQDTEELGEAKVREVESERSLALLNDASKKEAIQPKHLVITR